MLENDATTSVSQHDGVASDVDEDRFRESLQTLPRIPSLRRHPIQLLVWLVSAGVGLGSLIVLLSLAATIPIVNLCVLGYLMEIQARVGRSGRFRSAFFLVPAAGRLAGIALGVALWLLPIRFLGGAARDSWLLAPGSTAAWLWAGALAGATIVVTAHLLLAIGCGGGWSRFLRPVSNVRHLRTRLRSGRYWPVAQQAILGFISTLGLPHLLWLGLLGFAAAYTWLAVPTYLFTMLDDPTSRSQVAAFLVGGALLTLGLMWAPLLLAHVAHEARWQAIFEGSTVVKLAGRTPFCWAVSTAILLACSALPLLYTALFKNPIPPHAANWDLMFVFLITVVPARVLVGWVYHRATQREQSATSWSWRIWRIAVGTLLALGVGWYVYFLYLAQTGGELGERAIWQLHALLLPWTW